MAFTLVSADFRGVKLQGPVRSLGEQIVDLEISAAATDTALDIGTDAGTFWTAVAKPAILTELKNLISGKVKSLISVESQELTHRLKVAAAAGAGQYALTVSNTRPLITWFNGDAPTSYVVRLNYKLKPNQFPVFKSY